MSSRGTIYFFFLAPQGLQAPQAFLALHGLHAPQAFFAAQGLQPFAAHGLQPFLAAQGLHALQAARRMAPLLAFDTAVGFAKPSPCLAAACVVASAAPAAIVAPKTKGMNVLESSLDLWELTARPPYLNGTVRCLLLLPTLDVGPRIGAAILLTRPAGRCKEFVMLRCNIALRCLYLSLAAI